MQIRRDCDDNSMFVHLEERRCFFGSQEKIPWRKRYLQMIKMQAHTHAEKRGRDSVCGPGAVAAKETAKSREGELTFGTDKSHCLVLLYSRF